MCVLTLFSSTPSTQPPYHHQAKLDWKKAREEKEEAERRRIDQIEADLQRKQRVDAIKRANQLMYEQTDKMKFLRGQQLYTDVIADREDQITLLHRKKEELKVDEQKWHDDMMVRLKESDRRQHEEVSRRKNKSKAISEIQQKQLLDTKNQLIKKLEADFVEGQLMKEMIQQDILDEQKIHYEKLQEAKERNAAMREANMNLQDLRTELLKVEGVEAAKRAEQVATMDRIVKARHGLEKKHFAERQAIRMKLIEIATKDLNARKEKEDGILEKHHAESEAKHQKEMAYRADRKKRQDAAIDRSRQMQIKLRQERKGSDKAAAALLAEHWKERNAEIEEEQHKEHTDR